MEQTLLLNVTYEPLRLISWQKAVALFTLGKVEVVEEYDREVRSVSFVMKLPAVVRLLRCVKWRDDSIPFSRRNIYVRDHGKCQYCGESLSQKEITFDHVIPQSQGGQTTWENIVVCCVACNAKKGGRTPKQAGMKLLSHPQRPAWNLAFRLTIGIRQMPTSWRDYLYWNLELTQERQKDYS